jgi:DUF1680 family protein
MQAALQSPQSGAAPRIPPYPKVLRDSPRETGFRSILPLFLLLALVRPWPGVVVAAEARSESTPAVQAFDLSRVRLLDGPFKQMQDLHRTGLVGQLAPDKLLYPFRQNAGLPQPEGVTGGYGGWDDAFIQGHYAGHYLSAAARMWAATGDPTFRDKAGYMVRVLAECQAKLGDGYLAAFPVARLDKLEANPRQGLVEYYTLHKVLAGLVDAASYGDNPQALEVATRLSDYIAGRMAKLGPEQVEVLLRTDYTGNPVNEFGGMAEALSQLGQVARRRGDPRAERHLRLAAVFNRDWFVNPLLEGEDRLNGLHGNTHIAQAGGLARYAVVTGDDRAGQAAQAFWKLVVERHSFVNGGNAFDEKLRAPGLEVTGTGEARLSPLTAEYCNTHNMLKLTRTLFERDPAAAYADYYEQALYNHILAGIAPDHGRVIYHMPMRPGDFRVYLDEPFCCQGTGIENTARFGEAIYFHRADTLWINLFIASTLDWREQGLRLRLETRYPDNGEVRLTIEAERRVPAELKFRIPAWVQGAPVVTVNGKPAAPSAKSRAYLSLRRTWKPGDRVTLHLPLTLRVRPSIDDPSTVSLLYGPALLAGKLGREGMPASDIGGHHLNAAWPPFPVPVFVSPTPTLPDLPVEPDPAVPLSFTARMASPVDGRSVDVSLAPLYRVHHQRYAVYWKVIAPGQWQPALPTNQIDRGSQ